MLRCILRCFEAVLGLRINFSKSTMFVVKVVFFSGNVVKVVKIDVLAANLGCRVGYLLATYLGLPLGNKRKVWSKVIEVCEGVWLIGKFLPFKGMKNLPLKSYFGKRFFK